MSNMPVLLVLGIVAALFLIGQTYLHIRRRKARTLFRLLAQQSRFSAQGKRMQLLAGGHQIVLDAQVTDEDRPEELRLTVETGAAGDFYIVLPSASSHYSDAKHRQPAPEGAPFAGWHVGSEDQHLLQTLSADRRFRDALDALAAVGFTRFELKNARLRALWPDFSWDRAQHDWDTRSVRFLPNRLAHAAEKLSDLATAIEAALLLLGREPIGKRVRTVLAALLVFPLLVMIAGILLALHLYDVYPTLRDEELVVAMLLAGCAVSILYTSIAYLLLRNSVSRGARAMLIGVVALMGFVLGSAAPILWWNGTGPQGPAQRVSVEVVAHELHSPLASGRGRLVRWLLGDDSFLEQWLLTYRVTIRSWREPASIYAINLSREQFLALPPQGGRLSLTVLPGAVGLEWYTQVALNE
jgi:hypothetical protein